MARTIVLNSSLKLDGQLLIDQKKQNFENCF